jgi:hypothetical protein
MPRGTKVHEVYEALVRQGMEKGKAARIAQAQTGLALATGKPPKYKQKHLQKKKKKPPKYKQKHLKKK